MKGVEFCFIYLIVSVRLMLRSLLMISEFFGIKPGSQRIGRAVWFLVLI